MGWSSVREELALSSMEEGLVITRGADTPLHSVLRQKFVISAQQVRVSMQLLKHPVKTES